MLKIGVLVSGDRGNLQLLIDSQDLFSKAKLFLVLSPFINAYTTERAVSTLMTLIFIPCSLLKTGVSYIAKTVGVLGDDTPELL